MIPARLPPLRERGVLLWLRRNLFSSPASALVSLVIGALAAWLVYGLVRWVVLGATWQQVWNNLKLFAVYRYPNDLLWRPLAAIGTILFLLGLTAGVGHTSTGKGTGKGTGENTGEIVRGVFWSFAGLAVAVALVALVAGWAVRWQWLAAALAGPVGLLLGRKIPGMARVLPWLWGASLPVLFILINGVFSAGALRVVRENLWGGFLLTLILAAIGIMVSFPLGVALALGRRSNLPAIKVVCTLYIEIIRGAPLIAWLFIASLMVPLLFNVSPDRVGALQRALVAIILFSAAYAAENVRGGLQSIGRGQFEAARALGLGGWQTMRFIILPQALRAVIPALVGQAIALFKDTTLVTIVGLTDFFGVADIVANQPASLQVPGGIRLELSVFVALFYFFFAYRMSIASRQLERQLGVGTR